MKKWIAMYSQTGSELRELCSEIKRWPDLVVTNNIRAENHDYPNFIKLGGRFTPNTYRSIFKLGGDEVVVTLHGWLKIVPPEICDEFQIYNGHPGDIRKFPQLKGKDPQLKAFGLRFKWSGSVIHKVTKEVDGGEIIAHKECFIGNCHTLDDVICRLKRNSIDLWKDTVPNLISHTQSV